MWQSCFPSKRPNNLFYQCENKNTGWFPSPGTCTSRQSRALKGFCAYSQKHPQSEAPSRGRQKDWGPKLFSLHVFCECLYWWADPVLSTICNLSCSITHPSPPACPVGEEQVNNASWDLSLSTPTLPPDSFARDKNASFLAWLAEYAKWFNPVTTNYEQMLECLKVTGHSMYFKI